MTNPPSSKTLAEAREWLLTGGHSLPEIASILAEGRDDRVTHEDVYFCFRLLLGRNLNPEEVGGHMGAVGQDLAVLVRQFLRSREFDNRDMLALSEGHFQAVERDGYAIYVDPEDHAVGKHVLAGGYEEHVTNVFQRFVRPGDTVVDIGANMGFFAILSAHLTGASGKVVAIEPNASNCRLMEASRRHNGFDHLTIHCVAAGESSGLLALNSAYSNGSVATPGDSLATLMRSHMVPGVRLDDLLRLDRLDFVKIDVEGFELDALRGFSEHLARFRPTIVSEFTPTAMTHPGEYLSFFTTLGYRLGVIDYTGEVIDCGANHDAVMAAWRAAGVDHIDILARQPESDLQA